MQIFKNKLYKVGSAKNRLIEYYNLSTSEQKKEGLKWYKEANQFCANLAKQSNLEVFRVVGIVAALSPQKNWQRNKELAYNFIINKSNTGHNKQQINKALDCYILNENEIYLMLSKNKVKTSQFYYNILHFDKIKSVTIDRHAIGTIIYNKRNIKTISDGQSQMTKKQYDFFADCYKEAAKELNLLPQQLQAIVWVTYRNFKDLPKEYKTNLAPF